MNIAVLVFCKLLIWKFIKLGLEKSGKVKVGVVNFGKHCTKDKGQNCVHK